MRDEQTSEIARRREAAVQGMIAKGYTRERAEYLLFDVVGKALFDPDGGAFTCADKTPGSPATPTGPGDPGATWYEHPDDVVYPTDAGGRDE